MRTNESPGKKAAWFLRALAVTGAGGLLAGCLLTPVPTARMAVAEAAIERIDTATVSEGAPAELLIATEKLVAAKDALAGREYARAGRLADQTVLDALVAERHADAVWAANVAAEAQEVVRVLKAEIARRDGVPEGKAP